MEKSEQSRNLGAGYQASTPLPPNALGAGEIWCRVKQLLHGLLSVMSTETDHMTDGGQRSHRVPGRVRGMVRKAHITVIQPHIYPTNIR